jgi:hypothetical protein
MWLIVSISDFEDICSRKSNPSQVVMGKDSTKYKIVLFKKKKIVYQRVYSLLDPKSQ